MRDDVGKKIATNKFNKNKYLTRHMNKYKNNVKDLRFFTDYIKYNQEKRRDELYYFNRTLKEEGNVAISTYRYMLCKDDLIKHKVVEIIEYDSSNDIVILERV